LDPKFNGAQPPFGQPPQVPMPSYPHVSEPQRRNNSTPSGRVVTLYPFSEQGVVAPAGIDMPTVSLEFHTKLVQTLTEAGLDVRRPVPGTPAQGYAITGRFVRIDPGSSWTWFFFGLLSYFVGSGALEVEGAVGDAQMPYAQLHQSVKIIATMPGFRGVQLRRIAQAAGKGIAKQAIATLKVR